MIFRILLILSLQFDLIFIFGFFHTGLNMNLRGKIVIMENDIYRRERIIKKLSTNIYNF